MEPPQRVESTARFALPSDTKQEPPTERSGALAIQECGASRDRTDDLMTASHALSQLSYSPKSRKTIETRDPRSIP